MKNGNKKDWVNRDKVEQEFKYENLCDGTVTEQLKIEEN